MTSMRWTRGPPDRKSATCLFIHLSELIWTVDRDNYNGPDYAHPMDIQFNRDRHIKIQCTRSSDASLPQYSVDSSRPSISDRAIKIEDDDSIKRRLIVIVHCDGLVIQPTKSKIVPYKDRSSQRKNVHVIHHQIHRVYSIKSRAICFLLFLTHFHFNLMYEIIV